MAADARESLLAAKELDICPLRMIEPIQTAMRMIADETGSPLVDAEADSITLMRRSLKEADFKEGVQSYLQKRTPDFAPLARGWATGDAPA